MYKNKISGKNSIFEPSKYLRPVKYTTYDFFSPKYPLTCEIKLTDWNWRIFFFYSMTDQSPRFFFNSFWRINFGFNLKNYISNWPEGLFLNFFFNQLMTAGELIFHYSPKGIFLENNWSLLLKLNVKLLYYAI